MIRAAEEWIKELGYNEIIIDSRLEVVSFYEKTGFRVMDGKIIKSGNFECIRMNKLLDQETRGAYEKTQYQKNYYRNDAYADSFAVRMCR